MTAQPISKTAEVIHIEILRRKRIEREAAARAATISVENRNLSKTW